MMLMKRMRTRKRRRITTQFWSLRLLLEACSTALQLMNELREVWVSGHPRPGRRNIISLAALPKLWDFMDFNTKCSSKTHQGMPFFSPQNLHHSYSFSKNERIDPFLSERNGSWGSLLLVPHHWGLKLGSKSSKVPCRVLGYRLRLKCAEISIRNPINKGGHFRVGSTN